MIQFHETIQTQIFQHDIFMINQCITEMLWYNWIGYMNISIW